MAVDADTVRRIAHLARIAVAEDEVEHLKDELNAMLAFVEQLGEVNVDGVEPMTSVTPMAMKKRADAVTDGGIAEDIVRNAPLSDDNYFLVPESGGMMRETDHSTIPGRASRDPGISCSKTWMAGTTERMCIACELGYLGMIDALEAERSASKKKIARRRSRFACDAPAEQPEREPGTARATTGG